MPSFHKLHASYPRAAYRTCEFCHTPLSQPRRGRTRVTCSDACRQKLFRWRRRYLTADQRRWDEADRRADRAIARWQKQFGPFDPDTEWGLRYRITRGISIPTCVQCGRPIVSSNVTGPPPDYCSPACQQQAKKRYSAIHTAVYEKRLWSQISPQAVERIRQSQPLLICAHCGIPFVRRSTTGRIPRFCSEPCRQAAYWTHSHGRVLRRETCAECGESFPVRSLHHHPHFCSRRCYKKNWRRRRAGPLPARRCAECGEPIIFNPDRRGGVLPSYCSARCRNRYNARRNRPRPHIPTVCDQCGAPLILVKGKPGVRPRFCSRRCQAKNYRWRTHPPAIKKAENCAFCGQSLRRFSNIRRLYCSNLCKSRARSARRRVAAQKTAPGVSPP